jgi:hypothetical protein
MVLEVFFTEMLFLCVRLAILVDSCCSATLKVLWQRYAVHIVCCCTVNLT